MVTLHVRGFFVSRLMSLVKYTQVINLMCMLCDANARKTVHQNGVLENKTTNITSRVCTHILSQYTNVNIGVL